MSFSSQKRINHRNWNLRLGDQGGATDPFWDQVILLSTLGGAVGNSSFVDLSKKANTIITTDPVIAVDSNAPLFGANTVRYAKGLGVSAILNQIYVEGAGLSLPANPDLCIELWVRNNIVPDNAAEIPTYAHFWSEQILGTILSYQMGFAKYAQSAGGLRTNLTGTNYTPASSMLYNTWTFIAQQFDSVAQLWTTWVNGSQVQQIASSSFDTQARPYGLLRLFSAQTVGPTLYGFDVNLANIRVTNANRYGSGATIPIPTAQFPTQ